MKKKQTKTGPKSVTGFSILKIYLQEKQQKEDWILNRKRRNRAGFFLGILLLLFGSMPAELKTEFQSKSGYDKITV